MTRRKRIACVADNPKPQAVAGIVAESRTGKFSDTEFAKLFNLLVSAVSHEMGFTASRLEILTSNLQSKIPSLKTFFEKCVRIILLQKLLKGEFSANHQMSFLSNELQELGVQPDMTLPSVNLKVLRKIAEAEILQFEQSLQKTCKKLRTVDFEAKEESARIINRISEIHVPLAQYLKRLMQGNLDFEEHNCKIQADRPCIMAVKSRGEYNGEIDLERRSKAGATKLSDCAILSNPFFCRLIVANIISNAKRSADEKEVRCRIELSTDEKSGYLCYIFKDNGNGMTPEIMEKLNRGEQVTTKTEEGDHGIGFWYCKQLAEKMGGKLYVKESEVGVGTTIVLKLKLAEVGQ